MDTFKFNFDCLPDEWKPNTKQINKFLKNCTRPYDSTECIYWIPALSKKNEIEILSQNENNVSLEESFNQNKSNKPRKRFFLNGKQRYVNQIVYTWYTGKLIDSKKEMIKSDCKSIDGKNTSCINPTHLRSYNLEVPGISYSVIKSIKQTNIENNMWDTLETKYRQSETNETKRKIQVISEKTEFETKKLKIDSKNVIDRIDYPQKRKRLTKSEIFNILNFLDNNSSHAINEDNFNRLSKDYNLTIRKLKKIQQGISYSEHYKEYQFLKNTKLSKEQNYSND